MNSSMTEKKDQDSISLDTTAQSGEDYDLTQILTSFGWLNDVIV